MERIVEKCKLPGQGLLYSLLVLCCAATLAACSGADTDSPSSSNPTPEQPFALTTFVGQQRWPASPQPLSTLAASEEASQAPELVATLEAATTVIATNGQPWRVGSETTSLLPEFSLRVFSIGDKLIPVPDPVIMPRQAGSVWQLLFGEGRIWQEQDDQGYSRAQLTVTLVNPYYANAHNGLLTFLYKDQSVTQAWLQVFQENVDWLKQDFWGPLPLSADFTDDHWIDEAKTRYQQKQQLKLPIGDWQSLTERVPSELLAAYDSGIASDAISATGLFTDGRIYPKPVQTRYGAFPYPHSMRHGVYSVAKSMAAALAVFHLNQRYGDRLADARIVDYVSGLHEGWAEVTFADVLSMATGTGTANPDFNAKAPFADETFEANSLMTAFSLALTHREKLAVIKQFGNYPWEAGEVVRYNTSYTYLLGVALQQFLAEQGEERPLWVLLQHEVYEKLGLIDFPMMHTQEVPGVQAMPLMGVGLYPTVEEAIKIALLFQQIGQWQGEQLLDPTLVAEVMQFDQQTGLSAEIYNTPTAGRRYHLGFWAQQIEVASHCNPTVPFMLGWGNNYLLFPKNGTLLYRFQDAFNNDKQSMLKVADSLASLCD